MDEQLKQQYEIKLDQLREEVARLRADLVDERMIKLSLMVEVRRMAADRTYVVS